jgi:replicative DNA helicase
VNPDELQLPPHSVEAEQAVLGCILYDPSEALEIMGEIQESIPNREAFYDLNCRTIWGAMLDLQAAGTRVEVLTLWEHLRSAEQLEQVGGPGFIAGLPEKTGGRPALPHYLDTMREKYSARRVLGLCADYGARANNGAWSGDCLAEFERDVMRLGDENAGTAPLITEEQAPSILADELETRFKNRDTRSGIATGLIDFDEISDGLQSRQMSVIAARPNVGKSSFGMCVVEHACIRRNIPTLVITYEEEPKLLLMRLAANYTGIDLTSMLRGRLVDGHRAALVSFFARLRQAPIKFLNCVSQRLNAAQLRATYRRLCRRHGIKLGVLDYLQLVPASRAREMRTYEVGEVAIECKAAANETGTALLALAQLNRGNEKEERRPRLSDLKDSGQIEQSGDLIGLLHRDRTEEDGEAELLVLKNRYGRCKILNLGFQGKFCRFTNQAKGAHDSE